MDFNADHFALFGLARRFRQDGAEIEARYRELMARAHPDRFTSAGAAEQRLALQWTTRINEAQQTLKDPLARAAYLLALVGQEVASESNTAMPADFLIEQMEWREAVAAARAGGDVAELEAMHARLRSSMVALYEELAGLIDERAAYPAAADLLRRLFFLKKLLGEIDAALEALDA